MNKTDCRICFKNDVMTFPIISSVDRDNTNENKPISEIYEFVLTQQIPCFDNSNLPNSICLECMNELFGAYKFILKAKNAEKILQDKYEMQKTVNEVVKTIKKEIDSSDSTLNKATDEAPLEVSNSKAPPDNEDCESQLFDIIDKISMKETNQSPTQQSSSTLDSSPSSTLFDIVDHLPEVDAKKVQTRSETRSCKLLDIKICVKKLDEQEIEVPKCKLCGTNYEPGQRKKHDKKCRGKKCRVEKKDKPNWNPFAVLSMAASSSQQSKTKKVKLETKKVKTEDKKSKETVEKKTEANPRKVRIPKRKLSLDSNPIINEKRLKKSMNPIAKSNSARRKLSLDTESETTKKADYVKFWQNFIKSNKKPNPVRRLQFDSSSPILTPKVMDTATIDLTQDDDATESSKIDLTLTPNKSILRPSGTAQKSDSKKRVIFQLTNEEIEKIQGKESNLVSQPNKPPTPVNKKLRQRSNSLPIPTDVNYLRAIRELEKLGDGIVTRSGNKNT